MQLVGPDGRQYPLNRAQLMIGRSPGGDIVITDPRASGRHAQVRQEGSGFVLSDMGSSNGTFVNGQRLAGSHYLKNGDQITIGNTILTFQGAGGPTGTVMDYKPAAPAPVPVPAPQPVYPPPPSGGQPYPQAVQSPGGQQVVVMGAQQPRGMRDYFGRSLLVLLLYYIGFGIVGLIFNFIFLSNARKDQQQGYDVRNKGCLQAILWFHIIGFVMGIIGFVILAALGLLGGLLAFIGF